MHARSRTHSTPNAPERRLELWTASEAADALRCSTRTIRRLVERGRLVPIRPASRGGRFLFRPESVEAYVRDLEAQGSN